MALKKAAGFDIPTALSPFVASLLSRKKMSQTPVITKIRFAFEANFFPGHGVDPKVAYHFYQIISN